MTLVIARANILLGDEKYFDEFDELINRCTETKDSALNMVKIFKKIKLKRTEQRDYHNWASNWTLRDYGFDSVLDDFDQSFFEGHHHEEQAEVEKKLVAALECCEKKLMDKVYDHL